MTKLWPYALGAFALFLGWQAYDAMLRRDGALHEQVRALETRNAKLEDEAGRIDTVYRTDTITLRKVRHATDTLLARDTVIHTDTVRQIVAEERRACSAALQTCEAQKANLRAQIANLDSTITVLHKQHPGWLRRTLTKVTWAAIGYTAGSLTHR
jgi:cell division protein FtsB